MRSLPLVLACLLFVPFNSSFAEELESGHSSTTTKDASGTESTTEKSHSVKSGWTGKIKSKSEETTTIDPVGLNNKLASSTTAERVDKKNGDFDASTSIEHADGTYEERDVKKETANNWLNKGKTTTTTSSRVVDPKGLGNKQTTERIEKVELNPDGTQNKTVTEMLNGKEIPAQVTHQ